MTSCGTVQIPSDHFLKRVRNEYCDRQTALVREFVQNSYDAGATRITFETRDDGLTVTDNGRGIEPSRMVEALLTLGGTVKQADSVGGFGLAKELLLYCHKRFEIRTLYSLVRGEVLQYTLETTQECFPGACFSIRFAEDFGYSAEGFIREARAYLATCQIGAEVHLNGERVPTNLRGRKIDIEYPDGAVFCRRMPSGEKSERMIVRANGLTMFTPYIPPCDKQVIVELQGDFRSMLSSNRDGLKCPFHSNLAKLIAAVTVDPKTFDRERAKKVVFPGTEASFFGQEKIEQLAASEGLSAAAVATFVANVESLVRGGASPSEAVERLVAQAKGSEHEASAAKLGRRVQVQLEKNFATDFVVSIEGTDLRTPPRAMRPATMSRRYRQIAQLWQYLLEHTIKASGMSLNFRVGFCLDPEKIGCFSRPKDAPPGTPAEILVRPGHFLAIKNPKERAYALLVTAAHEVAHAANHYHDESFATDFAAILVRSLASLPPRAEVGRRVRKVKL